MEMPCRTRGRQEIVNGRTRRSSGVFVIIAAAGSEGVWDVQWVAVSFGKVAAFGMLLQMQFRDQIVRGGCFGG